MSRVLDCSGLHAERAARSRMRTRSIGGRRPRSSDSSYKGGRGGARAGQIARPTRGDRVSRAVGHDDDATIRRISVLALEKMVTARTAEDARALAIESLEKAAASDGDSRVRDAAAKVLKPLAKFRPHHHATPDPVPAGDKPPVFINIDPSTDQSRKLPMDVTDRLTRVVKRNVEKTGYSTSWPGGLPTSAELSSSRSRAFIIASTVKRRDHEGGRADAERMHRRDPDRAVDRSRRRRALGGESRGERERLGEGDDRHARSRHQQRHARLRRSGRRRRHVAASRTVSESTRDELVVARPLGVRGTPLALLGGMRVAIQMIAVLGLAACATRIRSRSRSSRRSPSEVRPLAPRARADAAALGAAGKKSRIRRCASRSSRR